MVLIIINKCLHFQYFIFSFGIQIILFLSTIYQSKCEMHNTFGLKLVVRLFGTGV